MNWETFKLAATDALPFSLVWARSTNTGTKFPAFDMYRPSNRYGNGWTVNGEVIDMDLKVMARWRNLGRIAGALTLIGEATLFCSIIISERRWEWLSGAMLVYAMMKLGYPGSMRIGHGDLELPEG